MQKKQNKTNKSFTLHLERTEKGYSIQTSYKGEVRNYPDCNYTDTMDTLDNIFIHTKFLISEDML